MSCLGISCLGPWSVLVAYLQGIRVQPFCSGVIWGSSMKKEVEKVLGEGNVEEGGNLVWWQSSRKGQKGN